MIAGFPFIASSLDADARAYCQASGATDRAALNFFVKRIKNLGLWDSMVCWPLRSAQNAGTGSTAYSLGGLGIYNGTLVNGPTWGTSGVTVTSSARITDTYGAPTYPVSLVVIGRRISGTGNAAWQYLSNGSNRQFVKRMYANDSAGLAISGVGYIMRVDTDAQTLSDDFEVATGIVPSATNSEAEFFINAIKPAQTAGATAWGVGVSTGGSLEATGDGQFEASMHAVFSSAINATAFYNLYKSTLGQGLGLP